MTVATYQARWGRAGHPTRAYEDYQLAARAVQVERFKYLTVSEAAARIEKEQIATINELAGHVRFLLNWLPQKNMARVIIENTMCAIDEKYPPNKEDA